MIHHQGIEKIKMLVVYTSFQICGGAERFLLNFFEIFPSDRYEIDLLLFDGNQDNACMFDMIPGNVNVLPFLKQYSKWSPELMKELAASGQSEVAEIRTLIHDRNLDAEFKKLSLGVRHEENWRLLKDLCPKFSGYDIAIAFTNTLPLKVVAEKVSAAKKYAFSHIDFKGAIETLPQNDSLYRSEKPYYEKMNGIVCIAHQNAESFRSYFPDLADRVKVLLNINNKALIMRQADEFFPVEYQQNHFNILTIARIMPQKGIDLLLETAKCLKDSGMDFRWYVLGRDYEDLHSLNCHKLHEDLELDGQVFFLGERPNPFPYYKNCDLYVQTSRFEGRPLSIEEAMTMNCPIVTTEFSSARDQIEDDVNGRICPADPGAIAKDILELFHDPQERRRLADSNAQYDGTAGVNEYLEYFR